MSTRDRSGRHQWGPAPSGESRHVSECRRCGLQEVADWYDAPDGAPVEVVRWVTPGGDVLAVQPLDSRQGPPAAARDRLFEPAVAAPPTVEAITLCPGHPGAWGS